MERLKPSKLVIIERIATAATVLIWTGVLLMAAGLVMAYSNMRAERLAVAQAESLSFIATVTATPVVPPTQTASPTLISTPTPTLTPQPSMPTPEDPAPVEGIERLGLLRDIPYYPTGLAPRSTASPTPTASPTSTPSPTPSPTDTPLPTPTPTTSRAANTPPDRIVIPAINLDVPVVPIGWHVEEEGGQKVSVWDVPDNAAGWHRTSAYPGRVGNVVLNGHHNIRGEVFRYLIQLEPQARIQLYVGDKIYYYTVTEKHLLKERGEPPDVRLQNAQWIAPTGDERLTLVTCWPYTSNTHRLILVARPSEPEHLQAD
jgi:sortase A